jgi:(2Fe-2S) ferredoxin
LIESRCDPDVARRIDAAAARAGMRLQTIRRPGKHEAGRPAGGYDVGIADSRAGAATIAWWRADDLAEVATELETGWPARPPVATERTPLFLVCAHGRHDACCALRGRPVARALENVRPGRVWETTHLGGDRFAANVLVLPTGELYGRVPPEQAAAFADRVDRGEVVTECMRGRIGLPPLAQAALIYAHERLGIAARDALTVTAIERSDTAPSRVGVMTPRGRVVVTVAAETTTPAQLTCRGPQGVRARQYRGVSISEPEP